MAEAREATRAKRLEKEEKKRNAMSPLGQMLPPEMAEKFSIDPMVLLAAIGAPNPADVKRSQNLIEQLPPAIVDAAHHPYSARCVAFAMLIEEDHEHARQQWEYLKTIEGEMTVETTRRLLPAVADLHLIYRLPLMEMIQGSLADLSKPQYEKFRSTIGSLVGLDHKTSLFEFVVRHHLLMHLDRRFDHTKQPRVKYKSTSQLKDEILLMLSAFASASHIGSVLESDQEADPETTERAFRLAVQVSEVDGKLSAEDLEISPQPWKVDQLESCMRQLHLASLDVKKRFLYAAAVMITYDHEITIAEAEFFRAVAESLDCPVPVLAAGRTKSIPVEPI